MKALLRYQLSLVQARLAVAVAAGFNASGFMLLLATEYGDGVPFRPQIASASVGIMILLGLWTAGERVSRAAVNALYIVNTVSVAIALWILYEFYSSHIDHWVAFRPTQLGTLFTAMIAPSFVLGLFGIGLHGGAALIQFALFSDAVKSRFSEGEPTATLGFALAGLFILILRFRSLIVLHRYHLSRAEAEATRMVALNSLYIRDLMNTPLQTLMASISLLEAKGPTDRELIEKCNRAIDQLSRLNKVLNDHELAHGDLAGLQFDATSAIMRRQALK